MKVNIIAVGKLKEKYWLDAVREYSKRLGPYLKLQITEIADVRAPERLSDREQDQVRDQEGAKILDQIRDQDYVIALAIEGREHTSEGFAQMLDQLLTQGRSEITFVIGGSLGLSRAVYERADYQLSFSQFTFPHQLMRVILLEQIYRAMKINRGEPYHK